MTRPPTNPRPIRTLVVEDEVPIAHAHATFVTRVPGFEVVGIVHSGAEALRFTAGHDVDLLLLDVRLPDMTGLDVVRELRAHGSTVDVIVVTSAQETHVVRSAVAYGVVQYLLKPFTFASFRDKLERYADFHRRLDSEGPGAAQHDVDRALAALRGASGGPLPKGMSAETLESVIAALRGAEGGLSATEVGRLLGAARVTARRYLEHLADQGTVSCELRYGQTGRPERIYRWTS
ncbi:response regulator [Nocardioides limicola]|uniref:response regulator n=1 Tax=Nocardioides limicola TaxID=2803368 RepID=UPI00193C46CB|nr:response regulator [Nocardioides sp. DJM-14]